MEEKTNYTPKEDENIRPLYALDMDNGITYIGFMESSRPIAEPFEFRLEDYIMIQTSNLISKRKSVESIVKSAYKRFKKNADTSDLINKDHIIARRVYKFDKK